MVDFEKHLKENRDHRVEAKKECAAFYRSSIVAMYKVCGFPEDVCGSCKRKIWFVRTKTGKACPYTNDGISHFADCPDAAGFRKGESAMKWENPKGQK